MKDIREPYRDYKDQKERMRQSWLKKPEVLYERYKDLLLEVMFPPEPWSVFGSHLDGPAHSLVFWGKDEDGLPLWERLVTEDD